MLKRKKILVVDDDRDLVEELTLTLQASGWEITQAYDGQEGLEKARKEKPDLVLLNLVLPTMDGFQVCRELKNNPETKSIPVMLLTAKTQERDQRIGHEAGVDDYLTKPYERDVLLKRVKTFLGGGTMDPEKKKWQILIGDDDPDIVKSLTERLESEGFETLSAVEGYQVVELAHKKLPDLILLDIQMPFGMGETVLQYLRSRPDTQKIPVIVITGLDDPKLEGRVFNEGAQGFIRKPYDAKVLLGKIRNCLQT